MSADAAVLSQQQLSEELSVFYKFHSFSLEYASFPSTRFVFDALLQAIKRVAPPVPASHD